MIFSKKCEYALKALIYLSINSNEKKKLNIAEIAENTDTPMHFTSKILQELVHHEMVSSTKGSGGGFYLTDLQKNISVAEIVEMIDGSDLFNRCGLGLKKCSSINPCPIHNEFKNYSAQLKYLLSSKSIQQFSKGVANGKNFITDVGR